MKSLSTHSGQLERWLGKEQVESMSKAMVDWYGPPIAVSGVPGRVFAHKGGDFRGRIQAGEHLSALDRGEVLLKRLHRHLKTVARQQVHQSNMGFASFSDLVTEVTANGKTNVFPFQKAGPTGVVAVTSTLWRLGNQPVAGAAGAAAGGGTVHVSTDVGAFNQLLNVSTDTQHFVSAAVAASVAGNTLLLYDRLFSVAKTMNSTGTEAVTGVPTRYTSVTATAADYIGGNFGFIEVGATQLAATAHNWTTCLYTDQGGASSTLPSVTGNSGGIVDRLDQPTSTWFTPLASGDVGIKAWTQMQCSALVATGLINFCIGHPIAWIPCPVANMVAQVDGLMTAFNLIRIFDNACLAMLEVVKPATTATTYTGTFQTAWG